MPPLGFWEIIIILVIVLLLFGGKKIPQLARDLGTGFREFKKTMSDAEKEVTDIRHQFEKNGHRRRQKENHPESLIRSSASRTETNGRRAQVRT